MKKIIFTLTLILPLAYVSGQNIKLNFNSEGKFKIVQFTDIHYKIGSSEKAIEVMQKILDIEKPDLVVFTGDNITCKPQKQGWDEVLEVVISHRIPYATTLGNHDDEHDWTREQISEYLEKQPYSLFRRGPKNLNGVGNFTLQITNSEGKSSALLYFMDSNAYNYIGKQKGWGYFGFNQVEWYRKTSQSFTKKNGGKPYPALAFFHIPLQEYVLVIDSLNTLKSKYTDRVKTAPLIGDRGEKECPGILNTGMFAAMIEAGDVMGTFVGHDHTNNYIGCLDGICLAYGARTGQGKSKGEARVIELKENQHSFDTWIRSIDNEIRYKVTYPESFSH